MSEILKALKTSEQSHQRYDATSTVTINQTLNTGPVASKFMIALAFFVPVMLTTSWLGYGVYQQYQEQPPLIGVNVEPEIINVDSPFVELPYLASKELKTTLVTATKANELTSVNGELAQNSSVSINSTEGDTSSSLQGVDVDESAINDLSQFDLSQFSPELAQRVQSAFTNEAEHSDQGGYFDSVIQSDEKTDDVKKGSIKLSQRGADFIGLLPAMNFQTHVYSSRVDKRWVKINGSEFSEGDRVNSEVTLIAIEQRYSTIEYQGQIIEVPALYDWKG